MLKALFPILTELLAKYISLNTVLSQSKFHLQSFREEIRVISMKLAISLILSAVIIFSLIMIGIQLNTIILSFPDGPALSIALFSCVILACGIIFVILFKSASKSKSSDSIEEEPSKSEFDFHKILLSFLDGLAKGSEKPKETDQPL